MRSLLALAMGAAVAAGSAAAPAAAQVPAANEPSVARVRMELRALVAEVNAAYRRRDRAALERLYAEEYVWVHATGYVNDRTTHLDEELAVDSVGTVPLTFDPPEELRVYGDVAVLRRPFRSASAFAIWNARPAFSTWIFAKRGGRWRIVQNQATPLQRERPVVPVAAALLDAYAGNYGEGGRVVSVVRRAGPGLVSRRVDASVPPRALTPVSDSVFVDKLGSEITFRRGPDGRVIGLVIRAPDGRVLRRERMP